MTDSSDTECCLRTISPHRYERESTFDESERLRSNKLLAPLRGMFCVQQPGMHPTRSSRTVGGVDVESYFVGRAHFESAPLPNGEERSRCSLGLVWTAGDAMVPEVSRDV